MKPHYFQEQGLGVFLDKPQSQGWLELFTNTQRGCSVPDLAEFYANCDVIQGVVTSVVHGKQLSFNANQLGAILGVPAEGFGVYVRKDKSVLGATRLHQLTQRLSQQPTLKAPWLVKKGGMTPLHHLLFWFVIKNIMPCGQGYSLAAAMDICYTDLLDQGEQINLPTIRISHISRSTNTAREHDLGYGFSSDFSFLAFRGASVEESGGVGDGRDREQYLAWL